MKLIKPLILAGIIATGPQANATPHSSLVLASTSVKDYVALQVNSPQKYLTYIIDPSKSTDIEKWIKDKCTITTQNSSLNESGNVNSLAYFDCQNSSSGYIDTGTKDYGFINDTNCKDWSSIISITKKGVTSLLFSEGAILGSGGKEKINPTTCGNLNKILGN